MASLASVKATAISFWDDDAECFIVHSPLLPTLFVEGDSEAEAHSAFDDMLVESFDQSKTAISRTKSGRPAKNGINIHAQITPETKRLMDDLSNLLDISQGELIDCATFAFDKSVKRRKPKLLIVSPPRKLVPIFSYKGAIAPRSVLKFETTHEGCASRFDGQVRWQPEQPWHYRWFNELNQPIDFIGKIKSTTLISSRPFLYSVELDVQHVPSFAQKTTTDEIVNAQKQLKYIEQNDKDCKEERFMDTLFLENKLAKLNCSCNPLEHEIEDWGCSKCVACKNAYDEIDKTQSHFKFNCRAEKFARMYGNLELVWESVASNSWDVWIKQSDYVGRLSSAPCDLMLQVIPLLDNFRKESLNS